MKFGIIALICVSVLSMQACSQGKGSGKAVIKTKTDSASYAIGMSVAQTIIDQKLVVNPELIGQALIDMYTLDTAKKMKPALTMDDMMKVLSQLQAEQMEKAEMDKKKAGESAKGAGRAFLETNKKRPGVKVTASGLQYEVIKEGTGPKPVLTSKVKVHYTGTLINGQKFDSSVDRGQPAEFPLNGVIKGWTEGLQLMPVGSKYKLYIPSELGYGETGAGGSIGPNETLVFEVELLEILP